MMYDNTFRWALTISVVVHLAFIVRMPFLSFSAYQKMKNVLEITYEKAEKANLRDTVQITDSKKNSMYAQKIIKNIPLPKSGDTILKPSLGVKEAKKIEKIPIALTISEKKINIVDIKSDIPKSKAYDLYYAKIRETIEKCAYNNFSRNNEGSVHVSFVVLKNGTLADVLVHDEKSSPDADLKSIVKKSINEAAPFEPFPSELNYPKITFSVEVLFKLK